MKNQTDQTIEEINDLVNQYNQLYTDVLLTKLENGVPPAEAFASVKAGMTSIVEKIEQLSKGKRID